MALSLGTASGRTAITCSRLSRSRSRDVASTRVLETWRSSGAKSAPQPGHAFARVQHEQELAVRELRRKLLSRRSGAPAGGTDFLGDLTDGPVGVAARREVDRAHAVGVASPDSFGDRSRQRRLADPGRSGQRKQTALRRRQCPRHSIQLGISAEQPPRCRVRRRRAGHAPYRAV